MHGFQDLFPDVDPLKIQEENKKRKEVIRRFNDPMLNFLADSALQIDSISFNSARGFYFNGYWWPWKIDYSNYNQKGTYYSDSKLAWDDIMKE